MDETLDLRRHIGCYLDKKRNQLIYLGPRATPSFWDHHWLADHTLLERITAASSTLVTKLISQYLKPQDGVILEGGCGTGIHVAALGNNGYRCIGVDYAPHTVRMIQESMPELDVRLGDVRHLEFEDASFAGYFSGGVIEHFWDGYEGIGQEMARVIRPGGYLFLTFPYMSPLRRLKGRLGLYPAWESSEAPPGFYQFALDHRRVLCDFVEWGFGLVYSRPLLGLRATKEELGPLNPLLKWVYDYSGNSVFVRGLGFALSKMLTPVSGHSIWLTLKKGTHRPAEKGKMATSFHEQ